MLPAQIPTAAPEIIAIGSALSDVIGAIKAKKSALEDAQAALPGLISAMAGISNVGADLKKPENQVYLLWAIVQALEPVA